MYLKYSKPLGNAESLLPSGEQEGLGVTRQGCIRLRSEASQLPNLGRTPNFSTGDRTLYPRTPRMFLKGHLSSFLAEMNMHLKGPTRPPSLHWPTVSEGREASTLQGEGSRRLLGAPLHRGLQEQDLQRKLPSS